MPRKLMLGELLSSELRFLIDWRWGRLHGKCISPFLLRDREQIVNLILPNCS